MTIPKKLLIISILVLGLLSLTVFVGQSNVVFAQYGGAPPPPEPPPPEPPPPPPPPPITVIDPSGLSPVTTAAINTALAAPGTGLSAAFAAGAATATGNGFPAVAQPATVTSVTVTNPNGSTTTTTTVPFELDFTTCGNPPITLDIPITTTTPPPPGPVDTGTPTGTPPGPIGGPPPCTTDCGGGEPPPPPPPPPALNDLSIAVKAGNQTQYNPNSTANLTFTVTNNGSSAVTSQVGFWPRGGVGANPLPNCPTSGGNPVSTQAVTMNPGESKDVTFSFNVGASGATAYAYASYNCSPAESNWNNNQAAQTYVVSTATWFESLNGDVGSQNSVSVTQTPPAGRYQSTYLLAGQSIDSRVAVKPTGFKVNNYTSQLVPSGGVYNYLAERFLATAKKTPGNGCNIPSGNANGFNYCSGDATFKAGGAPNGNSVWFIDGNLTIQKDLALAAGDSATFIVRGNITVNTSVKRADGIYIAGGTFNDADQSGNMGAQLVVNGGVYAQGVNLARVLGGAACPSGDACNNALTPANQFVFDPKYLAGLNNVLGTPSISWTETAP